eukprot:CAMPEP_0117769474 /NCGR_PEP_ID=MMETSP0947-20121206/23052_1 /TAXON_ID=44440 /ORGANISM="Chattonella subsalsa, Strain CCMP2191" /LENGTH=434 /DNA_ID=CAMNT_0005593973 /DNA_START=76 /DNA_END=1382 /DNA_ORIENTATION=-
MKQSLHRQAVAKSLRDKISNAEKELEQILNNDTKEREDSLKRHETILNQKEQLEALYEELHNLTQDAQGVYMNAVAARREVVAEKRVLAKETLGSFPVLEAAIAGEEDLTLGVFQQSSFFSQLTLPSRINDDFTSLGTEDIPPLDNDAKSLEELTSASTVRETKWRSNVRACPSSLNAIKALGMEAQAQGDSNFKQLMRALENAERELNKATSKSALESISGAADRKAEVIKEIRILEDELGITKAREESQAEKDEMQEWLQTELRILDEDPRPPPPHMYNWLLDEASLAGEWQTALYVVGSMERRHSLQHFRKTITAYKNASPPQVERAAELLDKMPAYGFIPTVEIYNIVLDVCRKASNWRRALRIFSRMKEAGVEPNTHTFIIISKATAHSKDPPSEIYTALHLAGFPADVCYVAGSTNAQFRERNAKEVL